MNQRMRATVSIGELALLVFHPMREDGSLVRIVVVPGRLRTHRAFRRAVPDSLPEFFREPFEQIELFHRLVSHSFT
jgi:hypothetical protein